MHEFWEPLTAHGVTFVSATPHFDTSDSTGMLTLNMLLGFAQFARALRRERTMSKMAGRAEKGLWNGGNVPLGYDYDEPPQTLTPNAAEVPVARFFFARLSVARSPCTVANEANTRGYRSKPRLVTRRGGAEQRSGGTRFDEEDVKAVVRNPVYKGIIRYGGRRYPTRHEAIIDAETRDQASQAFGNGREDDDGLRYRDDPVRLLKSVLRRGPCGLAMTPYRPGKTKRDGMPYLSYACVDYTKAGGLTACPVRMLPARDFEAVVQRVLADLGGNPALLQACVEAANREAAQSLAEVEERLLGHRDEIGSLTRPSAGSSRS